MLTRAFDPLISDAGPRVATTRTFRRAHRFLPYWPRAFSTCASCGSSSGRRVGGDGRASLRERSASSLPRAMKNFEIPTSPKTRTPAPKRCPGPNDFVEKNFVVKSGCFGGGGRRGGGVVSADRFMRPPSKAHLAAARAGQVCAGAGSRRDSRRSTRVPAELCAPSCRTVRGPSPVAAFAQVRRRIR
jgi:hypothetical protein